MGGGGGGGSTSFKAQGSPPGFDYQSALGLEQLAVGGDVASYALSDQDFANRYPALQNAYNNWQANLGQQIGGAQQGAVGQQQLMQGLGSTIAGRQGAGTTSDINAIRSAASTAAGAVQPIYNLGGAISGLGTSQAGLAQPLVNMGQQQAGIGQNITGWGGQLAGAAQTPYALGQQLLQEPVDPQTQQQMMRAGLSGAAGSLGAASLGQGMAGQAAAARQLGLSTLQYGQAMRGEAMQDIGQYGSMLGAAGQMQGLGASTIGAGGQTMGLGGQQLSQAGQLYGLGGQQYGLGAQTAAQAGGLSAQAQQGQETYGMDTAQMAQIYGNLQQAQQSSVLGQIANANQIFQKRPFGLGGTNLAQAELGQAGSYNSFQQGNYATMNGIAFNQAQLNAQQQQLQSQQTAGMVSAGVGLAGTAASTGAMVAAMSCWVARAVYGEHDPRWKIFRHWLMNKANTALRISYMKYGQALALRVERNRLLRSCLKLLMDPIVKRTVYVAT
jgi:hypothetical protein